MATELKYKILLLNDLKHQSIIKFFDSFNKINSGYNFISFKKEIKDTIGILNRDLDFLVDLVTSKN